MIDDFCPINCEPLGNYTLEIGQLDRRGYKIFDFDYPFYEESHRKEFERKFILHFRYHEIGQESIDRFKKMLQDVLTFNFPKYQHYYEVYKKSKELPWWDNKNYFVDEIRDVDRKMDANSVSNDKSNSTSGNNSTSTDVTDSTNKYLDTPQGNIKNLTDGYLTNATLDHNEDVTTSESNSSSNTESNSTGSNSRTAKDKYVYHREEHGNVGVVTQGSIINSWLKYALINVDKIMMDDCESLFMQVY